VLFLAVSPRLFARVLSAQSVNKGTKKGDNAMTLKDYLELRRKGWSDGVNDLSDIPGVVNKYNARISEIDSMLEHLSPETLATPVDFVKRY
jgi:hypothetical protein